MALGDDVWRRTCQKVGRVSPMADPADSTSPSRHAAVLLVVAAATLWSLGGVGVKLATGAGPLVVAGVRSAFAFAFMASLLVVRGGLRQVGPLLRRPLVWAAAGSYALMVVMFVLSARRTTAANAIFIQYTGPIYVALLGGPLLGERASRRDWIVVLVCLIGMGLTFGGELELGGVSDEARTRAIGDLLAVLSSFGFAGLPLLLRVDQRTLPSTLAPWAPLVAMALGNALATTVAIPEIVRHPPVDAKTLLVLSLLGTFQIGLPYVLYGIAVRRLRALESSLIATIEPMLAPIWVFGATGETPTALAVIGGVLIVGAVAVETLLRRRDVGASRAS